MAPTLDQLRYRHPEHRAKANYWDLLSCMVAGGERMSLAHKRQLLTNPDGRPPDVVEERMKLAPYINKMGPILSRFQAQMMAQEGSYDGSKDKFWSETFMGQGAFLETDDDARASFHAFLGFSILQAMTTGKAIAQIDTRVASGKAQTRTEQSQLKEDEPYVIPVHRCDLWDWQHDRSGFKFAKIHRFALMRESWDSTPVPQHDFTIYQRLQNGQITTSRYQVQRRKSVPEEDYFELDGLLDRDVLILTQPLESGALLENQEIFNLNGTARFPIVTLSLPSVLWVADQLFDPQKSFFNQTAGLEWALVSTNYAMPVISGVDDDMDDPTQNSKFGNGYYLTLRPDQSISWLERPGSGFTTAMSYRAEVKRDIYEAVQQIAMSAADGAATIARSGESKKEDRHVEEILLETYGRHLREYAQNILNVASIAHGEEIQWTVTGFDDFQGEGLAEDIADYTGVSSTNIPSETFTKAMQKQFIRRAANAMNLEPQVVQTSLEEVDQYRPPISPTSNLASKTPPLPENTDASPTVG